jgi:hypothetical protein
MEFRGCRTLAGFKDAGYMSSYLPFQESIGPSSRASSSSPMADCEWLRKPAPFTKGVKGAAPESRLFEKVLLCGVFA